MLELLKPYKITDTKIRLGPQEDGGYVVNSKGIELSSTLYTYGVGNDIRFEQDYVERTGKPAYLFDHTIGRKTGDNFATNLNFVSEGLGFGENCKSFIDHYNQHNESGLVLLKIDIEGGEYDYFSEVDIEKISNITSALLLEVHWLANGDYRNKAENILRKLYEHFTLVHIHGNSWSTVFEYKGFSVPETYELTLVPTKLWNNIVLDTDNYPIEGIDYSNRAGHPDNDLSFLHKI